MPEYTITTQLEDMDLDIIHSFISQSYWARGIPMATLERALRHSLCFGVMSAADGQVGFARMITDTATFAYLADVFIVPEHRGRELSKRLLTNIMQHPQLQGLRRTLLATRDAHGLYDQFGFQALASPETFMEIYQPGIYAK